MVPDTVRTAPRRRAAFRLIALLAASAASALAVAGCATSPSSASSSSTGKLRVVAAEDFWGSLASQLGGDRVAVRSVIDNPNADPHAYEPTAADGRDIAAAQVVIVNGVGYDPWASSLTAANPATARRVLNVGDIAGIAPGQNPHRWYSPDDVRLVIDRISTAYQQLDAQHADYYRAQRDQLLTSTLKPYFDLVAQLKATYHGTPVGASESIFTPMAQALGLDLITPESFLDAISEGADPSAADKATIDAQLRDRQLKVYVYNSQNATPDVAAQVALAREHGIPVATVTETLTPQGATFQQWQVRQLTELQDALRQATGR